MRHGGHDVDESLPHNLDQSMGERFEGQPVLVRTVARGDVGLKSGQAILDIDAGEVEALLAFRSAVDVRLSQLLEELGPPPGL